MTKFSLYILLYSLSYLVHWYPYPSVIKFKYVFSIKKSIMRIRVEQKNLS